MKPSILAVAQPNPLVNAKADTISTSDGTSVGVYKDHNQRVCIVTKVGHTRTHFVELMKGELIVRSLPDEFFYSRFTVHLTGYPLDAAVRKFLTHAGGVSVNARQALNACLVNNTGELNKLLLA